MVFQHDGHPFGGAKWIRGGAAFEQTPPRSLYFRRAFVCPRPITRATLYVSSDGEAETYCNGVRTDGDRLSQGACRDACEFRELDLSRLIAPGENAIGCLTGNGRRPFDKNARVNRVLMRLILFFEDGDTLSLCTDGSWKCAPSPIVENSLSGERYDARREIPGWCGAAFDDSAWQNAVCDGTFRAPLIRRAAPPVIVTRALAPVGTSAQNGEVILDFGESVSGRYVLSLSHTRAGQEIEAVCAESADKDGSDTDRYICKGAEEETYAPRFAFTRFRYLRLRGADAAQVGATACVWQNALSKAGTVQSGYRFLRDVFRAAERLRERSCLDGFTDCRAKTYSAYAAQLCAGAACFSADCSSLLARWTARGAKDDLGAWGADDETYLLPWTLYRFYGDREILKTRASAIFALARSRCARERDGLPELGEKDVAAPTDLPRDFFAHAYYCLMLSTVARIGEALGDFAAAEEFTQKLENARWAFRKRYFLPLENDFTPRSQSALVLPLAFDILPPHRRAAAARRLRERILSDGALTAKGAGARYILNVLCENGQSDAAFFLLEREKSAWCGRREESLLPAFAERWMFECLAGIRPRESEPGFTHLVLAPVILPRLGSFKAEFHSAAGKIRTEWSVSGHTVTYAFTAAQSVTLMQPDGVIRSFPPGRHKAMWRCAPEE